jgi:hypothetical protein
VTERKRRPWYSWRRWGGRVLISLALFAGWLAYQDYTRRSEGERERAAALAELDEQFPEGWRFEAVFGRRPTVAPERNAALAIPALGKAIPQRWLNEIPEGLFSTPAPVRPDPANLALLREKLAEVRDPLEKCRRFATEGEGRVVIEYQTNFLQTSVVDAQRTRKLVYLLALDALVRSEDGDTAGAMQSCRAALKVASWLKDEPCAIVQLIRVADTWMAGRAVERALAQGEPPAAELAWFQKYCEADDRLPVFRFTIQGEMALALRCCDDVAAGKLTFAELAMDRTPSRWEQMREWPLRRWYTAAITAHTARSFARVLAVSKMPTEQQFQAMQTLVGELRALPADSSSLPALMSRLLIPSYERLHEAFLRHHAGQRCLAAALAAERFRRDQGRWPGSLAELAPQYMKQVPTDPFDGHPLRLKRTDDGLVIYSVSQDGTDDGGKIDPAKPHVEGYDLGYRLYDKDKRRQPPLPPKPKTEEDEP